MFWLYVSANKSVPPAEAKEDTTNLLSDDEVEVFNAAEVGAMTSM